MSNRDSTRFTWVDENGSFFFSHSLGKKIYGQTKKEIQKKIDAEVEKKRKEKREKKENLDRNKAADGGDKL